MATARGAFPKHFLWGVATSAYQIEGAVAADGRGSSIWDDFAHTPGRISDGGTGDIACDHYHRFADDVALMKSLGVQAYRFSIAWPRVLPDGAGRVEPRGVDFYDRLVDALLEAGITPWITLYHWDLPSALQRRGGWGNRDIAGWFADYAALMARALGDRARHWITLNEPWCIAFLSHEIGAHAPGLQDRALAFQAAHNTLLAHGHGLQAIRAAAPRAAAPLQAGITLNFEPNLPLTDSAADARAADLAEARNPFYGWFSTPILRGHYGPEVWADAGALAPRVQAGDMALVSQNNDFIGINNYTVGRVIDKNGTPELVRNTSAQHTLMDWEVAPEGMKTLLLRLNKDANGRMPLYITENGASFTDTLDGDGRIRDERRTAYFRRHLNAVREAIQAGADVRGYFAWSLVDNFEWAHGYQQFFGIVHVDYATQKRTVKDSGYYYRDCIAANAVL
jgi:beta-glucosidase